jgi:hypothetical protein
VSAPALERVTFSTPRDAGYTQIPTLEKLTGQPAAEFGHVILKELVDNSLDACENAGIAPEISVTVTPGGDGIRLLAVEDNGRGIPAATVAGFCDFTRSASDKAAYRSPTRGMQGNAWPCIISIPYALRVRPATVVIEAQGIRHEITPEQPLGKWLTINHVPGESDRIAGTRVIVPLPASLELDVSRWAADYATVNPHATITVHDTRDAGHWEPEVYKSAGQDGWRKWVPSRPTSPHWYDEDGLRELISAHLAAGEDKALGRFVREFDGLTGTAKAGKIAATVPGVKSLTGFKERPHLIGALLADMQRLARPVKPAALGIVPEDHYRALIDRLFGISRDRCWLARREILHTGIPWAVDVVVAETERPGRVIYATNFGVTFGDPLERAGLRSGTWYDTRGAESFLRHAGACPDDGNEYLRAAVVHVQCGAPRWTDTGKIALIVPAEVETALAQAFTKATKKLREERERLKKDAGKERRRRARETRAWLEQHKRAEREPPLTGTVRDLLMQVVGCEPEGRAAITLRDLYGQVREAAAEVTSRDLTWRNFRQILAGFERDYGEIPGLAREDAPPEVDLSRHPRGPEECQAAARALGLKSVSELLVLTQKNDAYYRGGAADRRNGEWFRQSLDATGYLNREGMKPYNRGAHYYLFTWDQQHRDGMGQDGRLYANDPEHWHALEKASKAARALGLVDPELFADRRNKEMYWYAEPRDGDPEPDVSSEVGEPEWRFPEISGTDLPALKIPGPEVSGYDYDADDQPEVLFVLIEKSSMNEILLPLCAELGVNVLPAGGGYDSWTRAIAAQRRAEQHRCRRAHVFYISDYDAAGQNMPRAFARAAQYFRDVLGITAHLTIQPLMLTREQVDRYGLPQAPEKDQTELDALEAMWPGEFERIVRDAITARRDAALAERLTEAEEQAQSAAEETWDAATDDLSAELELIEADARSAIGQHQESERTKAAEIEEATAELRRQIGVIEDGIKARYADADAAAAATIDEANNRLETLAGQVMARWESTEFDLPDRPGPQVDVDDSGLLYDSRRHWLDQLAAYKAAKASSGADAEDQ